MCKKRTTIYFWHYNHYNDYTTKRFVELSCEIYCPEMTFSGIYIIHEKYQLAFKLTC